MEDGSLKGGLLSCLHYVYCKGGRKGGQRIYFKRAKFFQIPPHHKEFLTTLPLDQKKKRQPLPPPLPHHPVLTRKVKYRQYDEMVKILIFKIEN